MEEGYFIGFDAYARERLEREALAQGLPVEDLVRHAVMYYFADLDNGRPAARPLRPREQAEDRTGPQA